MFLFKECKGTGKVQSLFLSLTPIYMIKSLKMLNGKKRVKTIKTEAFWTKNGRKQVEMTRK
jgi:hypothetical protein